MSELKNPFEGYELLHSAGGTIKINPIHELVNAFYQMKGIADKPKEFYKGRYGYGKLASEAKMLYSVLGGDLDDCLWAMDKMRYLAEKNGFDWSIITCLKHKKL